MAMIIRGGRRTADWPDPDREPELPIEDFWREEEPEDRPMRSVLEAIKSVINEQTETIAELKQRLHPESYTEYLLTTEWKRTRHRMLLRAGGWCRRCKKETRYLDVHHLTYDRLGNERESDLIVVCRECHEDLHGIEVTS